MNAVIYFLTLRGWIVNVCIYSGSLFIVNISLMRWKGFFEMYIQKKSSKTTDFYSFALLIEITVLQVSQAKKLRSLYYYRLLFFFFFSFVSVCWTLHLSFSDPHVRIYLLIMQMHTDAGGCGFKVSAIIGVDWQGNMAHCQFAAGGKSFL